jgi:hypothetical protein
MNRKIGDLVVNSWIRVIEKDRTEEQRPANSGFAQRGHLCFKKSSSCLEVRVTFDTLEL